MARQYMVRQYMMHQSFRFESVLQHQKRIIAVTFCVYF